MGPDPLVGLVPSQEGGELPAQATRARRAKAPPPVQLPLFPEKSPLLQELEALEVDSLSPLEALTKLYELKKRAAQE